MVKAKQWIKRVLPSFVWEAFQRTRQRFGAYRYGRLLTAFPRRVVAHNYGGFPLKVTIADPDGAQWYDQDCPRSPEIALLATSRLRAGATVFNIGAHQGVVAMMIAKEVGPLGRVVAVDAQKFNVDLIKDNARLNDIKNITAIHAAGSDRPGIVSFGVMLNDRVQLMPTATARTVHAVTIDQLVGEFGKPDVVFLDVEGFECAVLAGGKETLLSGGSDWFVEVHVNNGLEGFGKTPSDVFAFFPPESFARYVASDSARDFVPLERGSSLFTDRFFLIALEKSRGNEAATHHE